MYRPDTMKGLSAIGQDALDGKRVVIEPLRVLGGAPSPAGLATDPPVKQY
jgi:hypothetical protein